MTLSLTPAAARHVERSLLKRGSGVGLRIAVKTSGCSGFAYALEFVDTPKEAATQAKKDQKLVMVLHVSGNFENPDFT